MEGTPLQEWANDHQPSEDLIYKDGYWSQIVLIRDKVPSMLASSTEEFLKIRSQIRVISTHLSKSVRLPVYRLELDNGIALTMRYNFHDWKISVSSPQDIIVDFMRLFDPNQNILSIYCEGFPEEYVYGPYAENKREFTVEISSEYHLFVFFWIFAHSVLKNRDINISKPN